jgi:isopenicillin N synthase-like dioxygenase
VVAWNAQDYGYLHSQVFKPGYAGYRPTVQEIPNGDGKVDAGKRFAHAAPKYHPHARLEAYYSAAFRAARVKAVELGVPRAFMPSYEHSCLRVLEYPPGTGGGEHTDVDLFTLNLYRNQPECLVSDDGRTACHLGEIAELLGLVKATSHHVLMSATPQHSIVFFAIPDHAARLPGGPTVGEWLTERIARSRVY